MFCSSGASRVIITVIRILYFHLKKTLKRFLILEYFYIYGASRVDNDDKNNTQSAER